MDDYRAVPFIPNYDQKKSTYIGIQYQGDRAAIIGGTYWREMVVADTTNLGDEGDEEPDTSWTECSFSKDQIKNKVSNCWNKVLF